MAHLAVSILSLALAACCADAAVGAERPTPPAIADVTVPFVANVGQGDSTVAYYAPTFGGTVFVTQQGEIVYAVPPPPGQSLDASAASGREGWALSESFVGGRPVLSAEAPTPTRIASFIGNDRGRWQQAVPTYAEVAFGEVWDGITVRLKSHGRHVEKVFTVAPGISPERIRVRLSGARGVERTSDGELAVRLGPGEVRLTRPIAYQEVDGRRRVVDAAYEIIGTAYGFRIGRYDRSRALIIDPMVQATYVGGTANDQANAVAINQKTGDVYVAGQTLSVKLPCASAPCTGPPGTKCGAACVDGAQSALKGVAQDAFVARFDSSLKTLIQATYLGGNGGDWAAAVAVDQNTGDVYVAGLAQVDVSDLFPVTADGAQPTPAGGSSDAFIVQLNGEMTLLKHGTYLGGSAIAPSLGNDVAKAIAVAPNPQTGHDEVYVVGFTSASDFPGMTTCAPMSMSCSAQSVPAGGSGDAFAARLNLSLTKLEQATYLGGSGDEIANALGVDATGVYVAGRTSSTDFGSKTNGAGTTVGAQSIHRGGPSESFVARFDANLMTLNSATYLGGSGRDEVQGLSLAPTGEVYVAGFTESDDLPCTGGMGNSSCSGTVARCGAGCTAAAQPSRAGQDDAFVAALSADLRSIDQATYVGGTGGDQAHAIAVNATGVYLTGYGTSTPFPCAAAPCTNPETRCGPDCIGGAQAGSGGSQEAFLARLDARLTTLAQATYLGGTGEDIARGLSLHADGDVYVAGDTSSSDFASKSGGPGTIGGAQGTTGGAVDGFVVRLSADLAEPVWPKYQRDLPQTGRSPVDTSRNTGTMKWKFTAGGFLDTSPTIAPDGTIYVSSLDANLYAVNSDGSLRCKFTAGDIVASMPALAPDGTIYVGSIDGYFYAITPACSLKWKFNAGVRVDSSAAVGVDGTVYVGAEDGNFYAFDPSGSVKSKVQLDIGANVTTTVVANPAIAPGGTVYVNAVTSDVLYALKPDLTPAWTFKAAGRAVSLPSVGPDGTIYFGSGPDNLYALKPDGTLKWQVSLGALMTFSAPAIASDGTIYVTTGTSTAGTLHAIRPDGTSKWTLAMPGTGLSVATGADGTAYFGTFDGKVFAVHPDGTVKWRFTTASWWASTPSIGRDGTVYVTAGDNNLYALTGALFVADSADNSIRLYEQPAAGDAAPITTIKGPATGLAGPAGIFVDGVHEEIFVANGNGASITVYNSNASGDAAPLRTLSGPSTGLSPGPSGVFVDIVHDELVAQNGINDAVRVYPRTASGDTAPIRTLTGPSTGLAAPFRAVVDVVHDELVVVNNRNASVTVYSRSANGDVAPLRTLAGPLTELSSPTSVAVDTKNDELFVGNVEYFNGTTTVGKNQITVYTRAATGNTPPIRRVTGSAAAAIYPGGMIVDAAHDELTLANVGYQRVTVHRRTATAGALPLRVLSGAKTGLQGPRDVFVPR